MLSPEFYQNRAQRFADEEKRHARRNTRCAWLRLLLMVAAVAGGMAAYPASAWLSAGVVTALLAAFAVCLKVHLAGIARQQRCARLKTINMQELACLGGDCSAFAPGARYAAQQHFYTSDLDIFGEHSLFRYINRTTSPSGSDMLAAWLAAPAATPEIAARQEAVEELSAMIDLRQEMQAVALKHQDISRELPGFTAWLHSEAQLTGKRALLAAMHTLPWATIAAVAAAVAGWIPSAAAWLPVAAHFMIYAAVMRKVNILHQQVSRKVAFISACTELIGLMVGAGFRSPCLAAIRERFTASDALQQVRALQNRIRRLDYRLNMLYIPVNLLFFFDYKHLVWLERWRLGAGQQVPAWFDAMARVEALSAFANVRHNHPDWAMPAIRDGYFALDAKAVGHPLIPGRERVCNDFSLHGKGRIAVVTGSNMSGKSTFERSIGVNMVLALAGAPVCAASFAVSNCQLYTYMRIADNLEEHSSSFYAELKRLKQLIDITSAGREVFFLLDEVLRGTNSRDRQIGSMALIRQLVRQQVSGIIATHDLALGELEQELPRNVSNAHFDVQINGDDMQFDYKLHQGICTSLNASILMRKIGIDVQ